MDETTKAQRPVEQVRRLLDALQCPATRIEPLPPPRPDVQAEIRGRIIMIEATDYHGDEQQGSSRLRQQEEKDARAGRLRGYCPPIDPLPGLTKRIEEKTQKRYDVSGTNEVWLAIFAGVSQLGAFASTVLLPESLDCGKLNTQTNRLFQESPFSRCYLFCEMTDQGPVAYGWTRKDPWQRISIHQEQSHSTLAPSFWDIQKALKKK
ncbi:MAG: hypothetical protein ACYDDO_13775 [Acidiferrobacterales bacterium]